MADTGTYLYAVTRATGTGELPEGQAGAPVRTIGRGPYGVVSTVPLNDFGIDALRRNLENLDWVATVARTHHRVVDAVDEFAPTAPLRMCTIYADDDRVLELLDQERAAFEELLARVSGKREWGVKVFAQPTAQPIGTPHDGQPEPAGDKPGTAYLQRLQRQQRQREDAHQDSTRRADEIHQKLQAVAAADRRYPPQDRRLSDHAGDMVLNAAYLVDDTEEQTFRELAESFRGEGIEVTVTGPWAPYSFAELGQA